MNMEKYLKATLSKHKATGDRNLLIGFRKKNGAVRTWVNVVNSVAAVTLNYKLQ